MQRTVGLVQSIRCNDRSLRLMSTDNGDYTSNPLQLFVRSGGSAFGAFLRGTIIGNVCLVWGCCTLLCSMASMVLWLCKRRYDTEATFMECMYFFRLPGSALVFIGPLLQPTVAAAVGLIVANSAAVGKHEFPVTHAKGVDIGIVAALGLLICVVLLLAVAWRLTGSRLLVIAVKNPEATSIKAMLGLSPLSSPNDGEADDELAVGGTAMPLVDKNTQQEQDCLRAEPELVAGKVTGSLANIALERSFDSDPPPPEHCAKQPLPSVELKACPNEAAKEPGGVVARSNPRDGDAAHQGNQKPFWRIVVDVFLIGEYLWIEPTERRAVTFDGQTSAEALSLHTVNPSTDTFLNKYGGLFVCYTPRAYWWILVDLVSAIVLGVLQGVIVDNSDATCAALLWIQWFWTIGIAILFLVVLRPVYHILLDVLLHGAVIVGTVVVGLLAVIAVHTESAVDAAVGVMEFVCYCSTLFSLFVMLAHWCTAVLLAFEQNGKDFRRFSRFVILEIASVFGKQLDGFSDVSKRVKNVFSDTPDSGTARRDGKTTAVRLFPQEHLASPRENIESLVRMICERRRGQRSVSPHLKKEFTAKDSEAQRGGAAVPVGVQTAMRNHHSDVMIRPHPSRHHEDHWQQSYLGARGDHLPAQDPRPYRPSVDVRTAHVQSPNHHMYRGSPRRVELSPTMTHLFPRSASPPVVSNRNRYQYH